MAMQYSFDEFVRILQREDARDRLLDIVQSPNFGGISVAPQPQGSTSLDPATITRPAQYAQILPTTDLPGLVAEPGSNSDTDVDCDDWVEVDVSVAPKTSPEPIPIDQAFSIGPGHPNWHLIQIELQNMDKENRKQERQEGLAEFSSLSPASRKRKQVGESESQRQKKRAKLVLVPDTDDRARLSSEEDAAAVLEVKHEQVSELWQPPPEVEGLRLSERVSLKPPRQRLAKVTGPKEGQYVFGVERSSKRKAQGNIGEDRPSKRKTKQQAKDASKPIRRSERLKKSTVPENGSDTPEIGSSAQPIAPANEPSLDPAPAPGTITELEPASYSGLVTLEKRNGQRPRLIVKMKVGSANLARLMR